MPTVHNSHRDYLRQLVESHLNTVKLNLMKNGWRKLADSEFRVSEIFKCGRQIYLERLFPEKAESEIDFDNVKSAVLPGTALHDCFQKYDLNHAVPEEDKVYYDNGKIVLNGHIDQTLVHKDLIVDYKSVGQFSWKYILDKPKVGHVHQINAYCAIYVRGFFAIAYLHKETYEHKVYCAKANIKTFNGDVKRLEGVALAIETKKIPPAKPMEEWNCKYCGHKKFCKQLVNSDK